MPPPPSAVEGCCPQIVNVAAQRCAIPAVLSMFYNFPRSSCQVRQARSSPAAGSAAQGSPLAAAAPTCGCFCRPCSPSSTERPGCQSGSARRPAAADGAAAAPAFGIGRTSRATSAAAGGGPGSSSRFGGRACGASALSLGAHPHPGQHSLVHRVHPGGDRGETDEMAR